MGIQESRELDGVVDRGMHGEVYGKCVQKWM